ncbi:mitochondrial inner membrane protein OXA1-like [Carex rostrata]
MAYTRRTLATAFRHFPRRVHPSLPHVLSRDDSAETPPPSPYRSISQFHTSPSPSQASGFGFGFYLPLGLHMSSIRCYSSTPAPNGGSNEIEYIKDVTEVLTDASTEAAASAAAAVPASFPGEVAAAAADSFFPVQALQLLIDGVHSFTGLNWWAAIALTTILIRGATVPLLIQQMKDTIKLGNLRPELEKLKDEMQNSMDPDIMQENSRKMKALFNKHRVTPFSPLKGILIQGPVFMSFFFAISNMVEKVPSLKGGGILWFTDLTTPDPMYIFPVLTGLAFLATVEFNMQEGLEGNPMAKTMKNFSRIIALLTVPFTASFPKAIFCYWITSNLFSLIYGTVLKRPAVKKFLNIPIITPQPSAPPSFSFLGLSKPLAQVESSVPVNTPTEQSQPQNPAKASSLAAINHRIGKLEKTVKARQKAKRR